MLFTFVFTHLLNHALGTLSLEAMEAGRRAFLLIWRNPLGTTLLYGAAAIHLGLGLWSLYRRRTLRMAPWEAGQLLLGLAIPPLLFIHVLGTRFADEFLGVNDSYTYILLVYFVNLPDQIVRQVGVTLVAWLHGCIGIHFWLRLKPWYDPLRPYLLSVGLLVPVFSLFGFWMAGRSVRQFAEDPAWLADAMAAVRMPNAADAALVYRLEQGLLVSFAVLIAITLAARSLRLLIARRRGLARIRYPAGRRAIVPFGTTILDASRMNGIAHAAVCGGRGRCSTCRVQVTTGLESMSAASEQENKVLRRVDARDGVRLACQTRVGGDCEVIPLLPPGATPREARARATVLQGEEREVAVLFSDLRGFTSLSEHKLPYDVVFILNRYFAAMGTAIEQAGGRVDKFIGDGVMALFGIEQGAVAGSRHALTAARLMSEQLAELNRSLSQDLPAPLRMGIGLHFGAAIVGEMGYGRATSVTAVGDTVNIASRLEAMTKEFGAELVVSESLAHRAGYDLGAYPEHEIAIRGRAQALRVRVIERASLLDDLEKEPKSA